MFAANVSGSPELVGRNTACRLIAGFINWLDALCGSAAEYTKDAKDSSDIRNLVMAVLEKCGLRIRSGRPCEDGPGFCA